LNGSDGDEWIRFDFASGGLLTEINLSSFGPEDDWNLIIDGALIFNDSTVDRWTGSLTFNSWFAVGADCDGFDGATCISQDIFRIRSVSVPVPGSLGLLGLGLAGLAVIRKPKAKV
jgi:PEP-CTERM motif